MRLLLVLMVSFLAVFAQECQERFSHPIKAKGIYIDPNPHTALEMATLVAETNLAKKISGVLQEEETTINNQTFHSTIKTSMQTLMKDYQVIMKKYIKESNKAIVVVEVSTETIRKTLCTK